MDQLHGNKSNCGFSLGRPRFESIQEDQADQDDEKQAKSIGLTEEEEEEEDDDDDGGKSENLEEGEEEKHICCACGKRFTSGKALGDHKRLHMLQTRKFSMVRPKMVSGVVGRYDERGEFEVDCCVCHKKFPSMKALYGHMRFHPDRGWKGVLPPHHPLANVHNSESISSDYDDDDDDGDDENSELWDNHQGLGNDVDLKESVKGWWSTRKRRRRSALKVDESDLKDSIDAENLLFLATTAESVDLDVAETSDSQSVKEMTKKTKKKKKKKKKKRLSEMEKEPSTTHQLEVIAGGADKEGGGAREKHVCVTCNKSFTSYQALGGHRASHNKVKNLDNHHQARANSEALLLGTEAMITGLAGAQGPNTSLSSNGEHVCNKCHKSFPTGQALGGHKRRHWTGPVSSEATTAVPASATAPAAASSSQVTETVQEVKKRKLLEFDLNELPPNEE